MAEAPIRYSHNGHCNNIGSEIVFFTSLGFHIQRSTIKEEEINIPWVDIFAIEEDYQCGVWNVYKNCGGKKEKIDSFKNSTLVGGSSNTAIKKWEALFKEILIVTQLDTNSTEMKENEEEYIDEFKACLEDGGSISERERRLLDKLCHSLNISPKRAKELELLCNPITLTDAEKEYLTEYKDCLAEGAGISDKERRLLDRLGKSLGISPERIVELESQYK